MYIILAILLLAVLIVVHEFGHFMAARLMKIDVTEFSVGFGPKLAGWNSKKYDTKFSIRAVPLGGFCGFYGEDDPEGKMKDDPRAFAKQNVWKRMFVILMGPVMNFVLAFVVAVVFFWCAGNRVPTGEIDPFISEVKASGPAQRAGLKDGDIITEINGVNMLDGTTETLLKTISDWREGDEPLRATVKRKGEENPIEISLTPEWNKEDEKYQISVTISGRYRTVIQPVGFLEGFGLAWDTCVLYSGTLVDLLKKLVTTGEGFDQTMGPVGIIAEVSEQARQNGPGIIIDFLVLLSINLGIMNLLPIPGLDGSRLVFGIVEAVRGKAVPPEKEAIVHIAGMVLLFGLMIFITYRDVARLFH